MGVLTDGLGVHHPKPLYWRKWWAKLCGSLHVQHGNKDGYERTVGDGVKLSGVAGLCRAASS